MTMLSTWPSIAIVVLAIAVLCAGRVFAFLDAPPSAHVHRLDSIDGLRGILVTAVMYAIVVCVSIATYSLIEKPGIETGRRLIKRLPQFRTAVLTRSINE